MNIPKHQVEGYFFGNLAIIAERILFIKRANRLEEYRKRLIDIHEFGQIWQGLTGILSGRQITIIATGIGPSMVGDAVYALDRPDSVCLYSGTCGGIEERLQIGDYFVADRAICGDGYSFHFGLAPGAEISGDVEVLNSLTSVIGKKTGPAHHGTTFTTSSVVREAEADFWKVVHGKCGIIEMAAAAFYAAASATRKRAAAYFWISDLPTRGKSFYDVLSPEDIQAKQNRYDNSVDLDLDLITSI